MQGDQYNIILEEPYRTVVSEYERTGGYKGAYESEQVLEKHLIEQLEQQGYEYVEIHSSEELMGNVRKEAERLNEYKMSESEWGRYRDYLTAENLDIKEKTRRVQAHNTAYSLVLDDGTTKNIHLIDKENIHRNHLQVINQYVNDEGKRKNRYDVTVLVNGMPMVHIELKHRGVDIKEAFNQIQRYQRESFWAGTGLYDYVQIFVISNGSQTKYYSNSTRYAHVKARDGKVRREKSDSTSFEFTNWWSDVENNILSDLRDFAATFLSKQTLLNILTRYCVFNVDEQLIVMRPYQIAATEALLLRIRTALNGGKSGEIRMGKERSGGYIHHTTGSGKTLTSFKTAQLAAKMEEIAKVLFVVDRKDLDYQTMKEYDNFEKDCANSNASSAILLRQLNDIKAKIIITTIQKLSNLLSKKDLDIPVLEENVVLIFDECHRSQFGEMHGKIVKRFKKYLIFGFTGTPIYAVNSTANYKSKYHTTEQAFGPKLHSYTIVNAINDKNVLPFKMDYESTMKMRAGVDKKMVWGIDTEEALHSHKRVAIVVQYILDRYAEKTKRNKSYEMVRVANVDEVVKRGQRAKEERVRVLESGFNSILAVDSVEMCIAYYKEFKRQQKDKPEQERLRVASIFTYSPNQGEDEMGLLEDENPESIGSLKANEKEGLYEIMEDYWKMFGTQYDFNSFGDYYKNISQRVKNKEIDILIVCGMFLTGFDAKCLNTLWVDKNLKMHGLLQAYSRTNRIFNSVKSCGNIVCFRDLMQATDESIGLFADQEMRGIVFIRTFGDYYNGYEDEEGKHHAGYKEMIERMVSAYPIAEMSQPKSEDEKRCFVRDFGYVLKLRSLLSTFDDFEDKKIVSDGEVQDYISWYNELHREMRPSNETEAENINDDLVFEIELVKQVSINIGYILHLVQQYHDSHCGDSELRLRIQRAVKSNPDLHDKQELIERFIEQMTPQAGAEVVEEWDRYIAEQKEKEEQEIIASEHLKEAEARVFIERSLEEGYVNANGEDITRILPPMPIIGGGGMREKKKSNVIEKLKKFVEKYSNM